MTICMEKAPVAPTTEAGVEQIAASTTDSTVSPFARRRAAALTIRGTLTGMLLLATTGFAEYHPMLALLLALLALATAPIWGTTGVSCNTSTVDANTTTRYCSTGRRSSTAGTGATGYRGPREALNTNRFHGGER